MSSDSRNLRISDLEIVEFINSEGWLLLPVVVFASVLKDKMTFYLPKKFFDYSYDKLMKNFFIEISIFSVLASVGLIAYAILSNVGVHGIVLLLGFVVVKLAYDFLLVKKLDKGARS